MNKDFRVENTSRTIVGDDLNYNQLPEYTRHVSLQIGDLKLSLSGEINGWLLCNGQVLEVDEYPDLFNVIGYSFGSPDPDHFKVPDFTSRVIGMFGPSAEPSALTERVMGEAVGDETVTLTTNQIPSHLHTGTTDIDGTHTHTHNANGGAGTALNPATGLVYADSFNTAITTDVTNSELNLKVSPIALNINTAGAHTHTFTTENTGGGEAHDNMQPTLFGTNVLIFSKWLTRDEMTQIMYKYN